MSRNQSLRLFYVCHEAWPTFRPDVAVLFGKYLPRLGLFSDLVTDSIPEGAIGATPMGATPWSGGRLLLRKAPAGRAWQYLSKTWHNLRMLAQCDPARYCAIQVRDMPVSALAGLVISRLKGLPFFYWMSFPQSEAQILRARERGPRAGLRYWFPWFQGHLGAWLLYRVILPRADHIFVQSPTMQKDLMRRGISRDRMTAVPMGVDLESATRERIVPSDDARLAGRRAVAYLGALDASRKIEVLLEMVAIARRAEPDLLLLLIGDTDDAAYRAWLRSETERLGIGDAVLFTGWLPAQDAWRYALAAEVGLSPIPRGPIFDCSSPTKTIEYLALGLPVLVNDSPDQMQVVAESAAGVCVELEPEAFARALLSLLADAPMRARMRDAGLNYVRRHRSYESLADELAVVYRGLLEKTAERHPVAG